MLGAGLGYHSSQTMNRMILLSQSVVLQVRPLIFMGDSILDLGMFTAMPMALDG